MLNLSEKTVINNRYVPQSLIAKGGMAFTYLGTDKKTGKTVVLKILPISSIETWKSLELFKREISVLKTLNHPQIPEYIDYCELKIKDDTYYILVQEYIDGNTLSDLIKTGKSFSLKEINEIFSSLLHILTYIHRMQPPLIHRDINPKNIIIDKRGIVHLVDFSGRIY